MLYPIDGTINRTKPKLIVSQLNNTYFDFPVTVLAIVLRRFGGLINSFRMLDSVASGNPLSSISSSSYNKLLNKVKDGNIVLKSNRTRNAR